MATSTQPSQDHVHTHDRRKLFLKSPNTEKESYVGSFEDRLQFAVSGMQGWRTFMEDAWIAEVNIAPEIEPNCHLFAVFDGHGGDQVAKFVASHFIDELVNSSEFRNREFHRALKQTFMRMDELILEDKDLSDRVEKVGCTACVCLVTSEMNIYVASAGDSRAILCRNDAPFALSRPHTAKNPRELSRVLERGATVENNRLYGILEPTRCIGDMRIKNKTPGLPLKERPLTAFPELKTTKLYSNDKFIMIGCDGVWKGSTSVNMVKRVSKDLRKGVSLVNIQEKILDDFVRKVKDNMTSILIKFENLEDPPPAEAKPSENGCIVS
mmetsp:Transcript_13256/g.17281  ORF Transcript_13256/g.17281 Transcript_13256/m.17281 type:complete len:325 (-) Transcript_13256:54-1028(-)